MRRPCTRRRRIPIPPMREKSTSALAYHGCHARPLTRRMRCSSTYTIVMPIIILLCRHTDTHRHAQSASCYVDTNTHVMLSRTLFFNDSSVSHHTLLINCPTFQNIYPAIGKIRMKTQIIACCCCAYDVLIYFFMRILRLFSRLWFPNEDFWKAERTVVRNIFSTHFSRGVSWVRNVEKCVEKMFRTAVRSAFQKSSFGEHVVALFPSACAHVCGDSPVTRR
jgi:hypothetical protein